MITFETFKKMLRENDEVKFSFTKKDGSERIARGTLRMDVIPTERQPKGTGSQTTQPDIIKYYDLDKEAWRCFHWSQFVDLI